MNTYQSESFYLATVTETKDKIIAIKAIIAALEAKMPDLIAGIDVAEYSLDDGQTKIKRTFRSPEALYKSIEGFEIILQRYVNQLNGRVTRLLDAGTATNIR